jgi:hypothetical protein
MFYCRLIIKILFISYLFLGNSFADCPDTGEAITYPSKVSIDNLILDIEAIVDTNGKKIFKDSNGLKQDLEEMFYTTKTKMGQFYAMLYILQKYAFKNELIINGKYIKNVLITAGVFKDTTFPDNIEEVHISRYNQPHYRVIFKNENLELPLNNGAGFYSFLDGKCQHLKSLKFKKDFSFSLKEKKNKNLIVLDFENVDFIGDFGARGKIVNVDLNYVTLKKVEFIYKTTKGKVTAKISDEEFKQNKHNFLLKLVNKFVSNTTTQPIDW